MLIAIVSFIGLRAEKMVSSSIPLTQLTNTQWRVTEINGTAYSDT